MHVLTKGITSTLSKLAVLTCFLVACQPSSLNTPRLTIAFFSGSGSEFYFSEALILGAEAAAKKHNVNLQLYNSEWNNDLFVQQFKEAIDRKPDGIAMMGHAGNERLAPLVDEAKRQGILVTSLNVPIDIGMQRYQPDGFGYVGQDLLGSSRHLAETTLTKFRFSPGDKAIVLGHLELPGRGARTRAALDVFKAFGLEIVYYENPKGLTYNEQVKRNQEDLEALLQAHPDATLLFDDIVLANSVEVLKRLTEPDDLVVAGFDLHPGVIEDIQSGYVDIVSDQQPFLQGYLAVLQLVLSKGSHFSGLSIDTGRNIVTLDNIQLYQNHLENRCRIYEACN